MMAARILLVAAATMAEEGFRLHRGPRHATDGEAHETAGRSHVTARADLVKGAN